MDMLTIREKHEYEHEIAELKAELVLVSVNHKEEVNKLTNKYEKEVKRLNVVSRGLQSSRSMWRVKYKKLQNAKHPEKQSRTSKARVFVQAWIDGDKSLTFKDIAEKFFLSVPTIKKISYDLKQDRMG